MLESSAVRTNREEGVFASTRERFSSLSAIVKKPSALYRYNIKILGVSVSGSIGVIIVKIWELMSCFSLLCNSQQYVQAIKMLFKRLS